MRRLSLVILPLCAGFSLSGAALADGQDGVRASYFRTASLPDGIAFRSFLRVIKDGDPEIYAPLVASALNISTHSTILERLEFFRETYKALLEEGDDNAFRMLCSSNPGAQSKEQTYDVLNRVDDIQELIAEKHYLVAITTLPRSEAQALAKFLNEGKTSIEYAKIDSRVGREAWEDVRLDVDQQCSVLAQKISSR